MSITKITARLRRFSLSLHLPDQPVTHCPLCRRPWAQCICGR